MSFNPKVKIPPLYSGGVCCTAIGSGQPLQSAGHVQHPKNKRLPRGGSRTSASDSCAGLGWTLTCQENIDSAAGQGSQGAGAHAAVAPLQRLGRVSVLGGGQQQEGAVVQILHKVAPLQRQRTAIPQPADVERRLAGPEVAVQQEGHTRFQHYMAGSGAATELQRNWLFCVRRKQRGIFFSSRQEPSSVSGEKKKLDLFAGLLFFLPNESQLGNKAFLSIFSLAKLIIHLCHSSFLADPRLINFHPLESHHFVA